LIITLVYEKNANFFCRKLSKIAENCNYNIDPSGHPGCEGNWVQGSSTLQVSVNIFLQKVSFTKKSFRACLLLHTTCSREKESCFFASHANFEILFPDCLAHTHIRWSDSMHCFTSKSGKV
jgi:hypothetical protein